MKGMSGAPLAIKRPRAGRALDSRAIITSLNIINVIGAGDVVMLASYERVLRRIRAREWREAKEARWSGVPVKLRVGERSGSTSGTC